jgi:hypothetical protein
MLLLRRVSANARIRIHAYTSARVFSDIPGKEKKNDKDTEEKRDATATKSVG